MKLIISGSRSFTDYAFLCGTAQRVNDKVDEITEVIFGGLRGAEELGKQWAEENGIKIRFVLQNKSKDGENAIKVRNKAMCEYADAALIFWDGESPGTKNMIQTLKILEKPHHITGIGEQL